MSTLLRTLVCIVIMGCSLSAYGSDAVVIADLNTARHPSYPSEFFKLSDSCVLFRAWTGQHGQEVWRTDGTVAGTELVADTLPGPSDGKPFGFVQSGDRAYFVAVPQTAYLSLWVTDGSPAGTSKLLTWRTGSSNAVNPIVGTINGRIVFYATIDNTPGLCASDGTATGTVMVAARVSPDLSAGATLLGGSLVFQASSSESGSELWVSDGSPAGTRMVKDIRPGAASGRPTAFVTFNSRAYFFCTQTGLLTEFWSTDGTSEGTRVVANVQGGAQVPVESGGNLYVSGYVNTPDYTPGVWCHTPGGTTSVAFNAPSSVLSTPPTLTRCDNGVLFVAKRTTGGGGDLMRIVGDQWATSILRLNGSNYSLVAVLNGKFIVRDSAMYAFDATTQLKVALPLPSSITGVRRISDGEAYFVYASSNPRALWRSDGTVEGTAKVVNALPGDLVVMHGRQAVFDREGFDLWVTDGSEQNTRFLTHLDPRTVSSTFGSGVRLSDRTLFQANNSWWLTQGSPRTTERGPGYQFAYEFVKRAERVLFTARIDGVDQLLATDGTVGGTIAIAPGVANPGGLLSVGEDVWFYGGGLRGLYRTGGTAETTGLVKQVSQSPNYSTIERLVRLGQRPMFVAYDSSSRRSLWKSDGTEAGTSPFWLAPSGVEIDNLIAAKDSVYFTFSTASGVGHELWRTAGTALTTKKLASFTGDPVFLGGLSDGDIVFFGDGLNLWRTVGGTGVEIVAPVYASTPCSPACVEAAELNGVWYFGGRIQSSIDGELWRTDGTAAGTYRVADVVPAPNSSVPRSLYAAGGLLYFTALSSAGRQIWTSDGTTAGTRIVAHIPSTSTSEPRILGDCAGRVLFTGDHPDLGWEIFIGDRSLPDCNRNQIHDDLDLISLRSVDTDNDGRPDECCKADFNSDGLYTVQDLLSFLRAWFASEDQADFVRDYVVNLNDLITFLQAWLTRCGDNRS